MYLFDQELKLRVIPNHIGLLGHLENGVRTFLPQGGFPVRLAVTQTDQQHYHCEMATLSTDGAAPPREPTWPFEFVRRPVENTQRFNAILVVPTGIGAEIGGHAGDATAVAQILAEACDMLITHPNVVSASDINELPRNGLYVEGSVLCRLLMGTVALQCVRANRVLVVIERHPDDKIVHDAVNAVNAARATYAFNCAGIEVLDPPFGMSAWYTASGSAAGRVDNLERLFGVLDARRGDFDAVAISSLVEVAPETQRKYFGGEGNMVNPWGGVEAMLTHAVSGIYDVPAAHAPMMESVEVANMDLGVVDPRMAAEAVSMSFFNCVLKGLHRSPRIVRGPGVAGHPSTITAADVSVMVQPIGCLGLATLAALEQGIPVVAVRENRNLMKNDLTVLPWAPGQLHLVENYWEAAGIMLALKAGIEPGLVRRPLRRVVVHGMRTVAPARTPVDEVAHA